MFRYVKYFLAILMIVMLFGITSAQGDLDNDGIPDDVDPETHVNISTSLPAGEYIFQTLTITNNSVLTLNSNPSVSGFKGVEIIADSISVEIGSVMSADGKGYPTGQGPGAGVGVGGASSGGGYGGAGGTTYSVIGGSIYGSALEPINLGSGGGTYSGSGGSGGGAISLNITNTLTINGKVSANGGNGTFGASGGSGGSILIRAQNLEGSGNITANGGDSGMRADGGGGGGRIAVYYNTSTFTGNAKTLGGAGTANIQPPSNGENGTVVFNPTPLQLNQPISVTLNPGSQSNYYTSVDADQNLLLHVSPSNPSDSFKVYTSFEKIPNENVYEYSVTEKNPFGNYDIIISPTTNGTYFIAVYSDNSHASSFTISASVNTQYVSNVYPRIVRNSSDARIQIFGTGFVNGMNVELRNQNTTPIHAYQVIPVSPTSLTASFDLTDSQLGLYDVSLIWPDLHEEVFTLALTISDVGYGMAYDPIDLDLTSGGTYTKDLVIPGTSSIYFTLQKSTYPTDGHWSWTSQITLSHNGNVTATSTSNQDPIIQIKNPEPGPYTITIKATEAGKGILTIWSSLPEMPPGDWVVDTIHRPFGSSFHQVNVPVGMDRLTIEAETMNIFSFFRIYYDTYGGSPKWITSYSQTQVTIPHPAAGRYIVEFVDPQVLSSPDQKRDILLRATTEQSIEPPPTYSPVISGFTPLRGGNTGIVTLKINGGWLDPNSTVILSDGGAGNITALSVEGTVDRRSLTSSFDLQGKAPGSYRLTAQSPNGTAVSAATPFVVEQGGRSEFWTEITGMEKIRVGRPARYILKYGNKGNLDMQAPLISLSTDPPSNAVSINFPPSPDWHPMADATTILARGPAERPDVLPAGSSFNIEFQVKTDQLDEYALLATPYGGDPIYRPTTLENVLDAACPGPGIPLIFGRMYLIDNTDIGPFGYGWSHTYNIILVKLDDTTIGVKSGNGFIAILKNKGNGEYSANEKYPNLKINQDGSSLLKMADEITYEFNSNFLLSKMVDLNGNELTFTYNNGNLISIDHSDGDYFSFEYNPQGRVIRLTDQDRRRTSYRYDPEGNVLTSVTSTNGLETKYRYFEDQGTYRLLAVEYPGTLEQLYKYDGNGRLIEVSSNDRNIISINYDDISRVTSYSEGANLPTHIQVDEFGRVVKTINNRQGETYYSYNQSKLETFTDSYGNAYYFEYDSTGNLMQIKNPLGKVTEIEHVSGTSLINSITDSLGRITQFKYDDKRNLIEIINPDHSSEKFGYASNGDLTEIIEKDGKITSYGYNNRGQVTRVYDPLGREWQASYNNTGFLQEITNPKGYTITMNHDPDGRLLRISFPDGSQENSVYNSEGVLTSYAKRNGDNIRIDHDNNNRVTSIVYQPNNTIHFVYDSNGNLINVREIMNRTEYQTTYSRDESGDIKDILYKDLGSGWQKKISYTYGIRGEPGGFSTKGFNITYLYDEIGRIEKISKTGENIVSYTYDDANRLVSRNLANGVRTEYNYDIIDRMTRIQYFASNGSLIDSCKYTYNNADLVIQKETNSGVWTYEYDSIGELIQTTSPEGKSTVYSFDKDGNRMSVVNEGNTTGYSSNELDQYTGVGSDPLLYDTNGNLIQKTSEGLVTQYRWDEQGRLVGIDRGSHHIEYQYDYLGRLALKNINGIKSHFVWDGWDLIEESDDQGIIKSSFVYGTQTDELVSMTLNGTTYWPILDPSGTIVYISNNDGMTVSATAYDPYGKSLTESSQYVVNRFNGMLLDYDAKLYYVRARWYDPEIGRFISPDKNFYPMSHAYTYAGNDPINFVDNFGFEKESVNPSDGSRRKIGPKYSGNTQAKDRVESGLGLMEVYDNFKAPKEDLDKLGNNYNKIVEFDEKHEADKKVPGYFLVDKYAIDEPLEIIGDIEDSSKQLWDTNKHELRKGEFIGTKSDVKIPARPLDSADCALLHLPSDWSGSTIESASELESGEGVILKNDKGQTVKITRPTTSVDPEDKYGPTGYDVPGTPSSARNRYIADKTPLDYRIDFWNAETATANVCDVDAYDQMDPDLNWSTFQFTEAGFTNWSIPLEPTQYFNVYVDPRPSMPFIVHIEGIYNPSTGRANLAYHTLDPVTLETPEDPLAGFLPPIGAGGREVGWFAYTIQSKPGVTSGTVINDQAFVNFDYTQFMPAPKDAPWKNTIDTGAPTTSVSGNLVNQTEIHFTLSGSDDAGGSGIKDYTVYGSDNGGSYTPYLNHITRTSDSIKGVPGHSYRFYSIGRDNVGNTEPLKSQPDATIFIPVPLSAPSAWFTASPAKGPSPLTVNFTDQSDNSPAEWNWNFGDGTAWVNGTAHTLSHTYTGIGSYMATLVVRNGVGQDQTQRTITVNTPTVLIANFTANVTFGKAPLSVQFNDTSTGGPTAWQWEFGDGGNSTVRNVTHVYHSTGTFTANLTVTNASVTNTASKTGYINVTSGVLPLPGFTNPPSDPDSDGLYEDLNANNRKDFNDVVLMFNQMQWIAANEPVSAFDFNGNERIDFNDIVKLFGEI